MMEAKAILSSAPVADPLPRSSGADSESSGDERTSTNGTDKASEPSAASSGTLDLTRSETRAVNRSKALVYLILLCAAAAVGTVTYFLTSNEETATFQADFNMYAQEIARNADSNAKKIASQVKSLGTTLTSVALTKEMTWPNVSMPHFDLHAREAEELTGIELLVFSPIVPYEEKDGWEEYAWENQGWIQEDLDLLGAQGVDPGNISRHIHSYNEREQTGHNTDKESHLEGQDLEAYVPVWQLGPVPSNASIINLDLNSHPSFRQTILDVVDSSHEMLSDIVNLNFLLENSLLNHTLDEDPRSYLLQPVMDDFYNTSKVVGFLVADLKWQSFFVDLLPSTANGINIIIHGTCDGDFSYMVSGSKATFVSTGDSHSTIYDDLEKVFEFAEFARNENHQGKGCTYKISVYPSQEFEEPYHTNMPAVYTTIVVLIFCLTASVFALYDYTVYVRQRKLHAKAKRTNQIVSSMFPKGFQDRVLQEAENETENREIKKNKKLRDVLGDAEAGLEAGPANSLVSKPIADLFTDVTIMFADVVSFTSWSSMREPSQVFTLLETIFHEFDEIAHRRRVFKVETVGDCYVAVCGLPDPRKDHAVVMARFARDCLFRFNVVTKQLENLLGPDTSELGLRIAVTAGVLRGERARFQLFGDTMNTTARIESTGAKNKIHVSVETAERLASQGKGHWCIPRQDRVVAKGKGELSTCWLVLKGDSAQSNRSGTNSSDSEGAGVKDISLADASNRVVNVTPRGASNPDRALVVEDLEVNKLRKLANWNAEILVRFLKEIVSVRVAKGTKSDPVEFVSQLEAESLRLDTTVLEQVTDLIDLPEFNHAPEEAVNKSTIELPAVVLDQLRDYVMTIAGIYRPNSFHNFEHASHVTMSAVKLLSRIVAPDVESVDDKDLHDHTYGIASDPLAQFALVLSTLIHDLDHTGVPNSTLIKEQATVAAVYKNKSVAEQNSVDIAWELLLQSQYDDLRRAIYVTGKEFRRFRQHLINLVIATDIMDKDLGLNRRERWNMAFSEKTSPAGGSGKHSAYICNLRANIVLEHAIQASDVSHTMQHWTVFRKWNACLFEEMYRAYQAGRSDENPAEKWYEGELGFFDFYVIPLAKKLKECGVFGVSSDEYLDYAQRNRREWETKGREIVQEMVESVTNGKRNN